MADYIVTIRTNDGSREERAYSAENRSELFKKLAADGINAISVREGTLGKKPRKAVKKAGAPSKGRGLLAAAIVVLGAGLAVWWMMRGEEKVNTNDGIVHKPSEQNTVAPVKAKETAKDLSQEKVVVKKTKEEILMEGRNPDDWMVIKDKNGEPKLIRIMHPGRINGQPPPAPIFKRSSENELASVVFGEIGERVIGITVDSVFRKDLAAALTEKIVIEDDDPDHVKEQKQEMMRIKDMLRESLKNGEDPCDLVSEAIQERNRVATLRENLLQKIADAKRNGEPEEEIELLRQAANKLLENCGAKLIKSRAEMKAHIRMMQEKKGRK